MSVGNFKIQNHKLLWLNESSLSEISTKELIMFIFLMVTAFASIYLMYPETYLVYDADAFVGLQYVYLFGSLIYTCMFFGKIARKFGSIVIGTAAFILVVSYGLSDYVSISSAVAASSVMAMYYLHNQERLLGQFLYFLGLIIFCKALFLIPESNVFGLVAGFIFVTAEIIRIRHKEDVREQIGMDVYIDAVLRERALLKTLSEAANDDSVDEDVLAYERRQLEKSKPQLTLIK